MYFLNKKVVLCTYCANFHKDNAVKDKDLNKQYQFYNMYFSASMVDDHNKSRSHQTAHDYIFGKRKTAEEKVQTEVGKKNVQIFETN